MQTSRLSYNPTSSPAYVPPQLMSMRWRYHYLLEIRRPHLVESTFHRQPMSTHRLPAKLPKERTCSYSMTGSLSTWPAFCMLICSSNRIWRPVHHLNLMSMCGRIWRNKWRCFLLPWLRLRWAQVQLFHLRLRQEKMDHEKAIWLLGGGERHSCI